MLRHINRINQSLKRMYCSPNSQHNNNNSSGSGNNNNDNGKTSTSQLNYLDLERSGGRLDEGTNRQTDGQTDRQTDEKKAG